VSMPHQHDGPMAEGPQKLAWTLAVLASPGEAFARWYEAGQRRNAAEEESALHCERAIRSTARSAERFPRSQPGTAG
jgi:hypothetical protein